MDSNEVLQHIIDLPHYPTRDEICNHFEDLENPSIEDILQDLLDVGNIIMDGDEVIVTAVTSEKLRKLIETSISIRDLF